MKLFKDNSEIGDGSTTIFLPVVAFLENRTKVFGQYLVEARNWPARPPHARKAILFAAEKKGHDVGFGEHGREMIPVTDAERRGLPGSMTLEEWQALPAWKIDVHVSDEGLGRGTAYYHAGSE